MQKASDGICTAAVASLAVLLTPQGIAKPSVLSDQIDLDGADIVVELRADNGVDHLPTVEGDLPGLDALFLKVGVILGDLAEGSIEDRNLVLDQPVLRPRTLTGSDAAPKS